MAASSPSPPHQDHGSHSTITSTSASGVTGSERLNTELSLLDAMYPGKVKYDDRTHEVHYSRGGRPGGGGGTLTLRLHNSYLAVDVDAAAAADDDDDESGLPEVITARDGSNDDIRNETRRMMMVDLELRHGEEVLDQVLMAFDDLVDARGGEGGQGGHDPGSDGHEDGDRGQNQTHQSHHGQHVNTTSPHDKHYHHQHHHHHQQSHNSRPKTKTVIIWLHHLLATSKRKLATSPPTVMAMATARTTTSTGTQPSPTTTTTTTTTLSGVSKPGYPGILIYSGATELVDAHVRDLRALKWQAFQVRWDSAEEVEERQGKKVYKKQEEVVEEERGRMDEDEDVSGMTTEWEFTHGKGKVVEVATMAELVGAVVGEKHRKVVLGVLGVK